MNIGKHLSRFFPALLAATVSVPAAAIQFETGEWKITMKSQNPMTGQPIEEVTVECIEDKNFDPAEDMMEDSTCRILDKQESDNSLSWKIECGGGDMPVFHGEGTFESHGETADGAMKMTMSMGTATMEMHNQWHGERVSSSCSGK
jgi:hypothetical protein